MGSKKKGIFSRPLKDQGITLNNNEKAVLYFRQRPILAAKYLLNIDLSWYQQIMLNNMWRVPYSLLVLGRGAGKTFTIATAAVLHAMCYPNIKVGVLGPVKRQGDFIFNEIEKLYNNSNFFKSSCRGTIKRTMERNVIEFINGSFIDSHPVGDGAKLRGARYNILFLDEYAQFDEQILNLVILPFLAVTVGDRQNKLILSSSAFYKWNHLWERYKLYKLQEIHNPHLYYVGEYDYRDILKDKNSPFKFDLNIIKHEKEIMTKAEFQMEWLRCVKPDTIISCEKGLKQIKDINIDDKVLTHTGNFEKVINTFCNVVDEDIIRIKPYYFDPLYITKGHKLLIRRNNKLLWVESEDVNKKDWLVYPKVHFQEKNLMFNLSDYSKNIDYQIYENNKYIYPKWPSKKVNIDCKYTNKYREQRKSNKLYKSSVKNDIELDENLARFLGYYLAEGSREKNRIKLDFHTDENIYIKDIEFLSQKLFNKIPTFHDCRLDKESKKCKTIKINSRIVSNFITKLIPGNCYTKSVPNFIFNSRKSIIINLLKGYFNGDGCITLIKNGNTKDTSVISSSSEQLILDTKELLLRIGIQSSFIKNNKAESYINNRKIKSNKSWSLQLRGNNLEKFLTYFDIKVSKKLKSPKFTLSDNNYVYYRIKNISKEHYTGNVHNISVLKDNSYVTNFITVHNCFPDDADTFYPSKLLEDCTPKPPSETPIDIELNCITKIQGENYVNNELSYVMGVDVGRVEGGANFAICIMKLVGDEKQIVRIISRNGVRYQEMESLIRRCTIDYNIIRIHVDKGGGGDTIKDLLAEPWVDPETSITYDPILDLEDEATENVLGLRYLKLVNFQGTKHATLFANLKAEMEHRRVLFPIHLRRHEDKKLERANQEIKLLKTELAVLKPKPVGASLKFEVPSGFRKDRAVALTLALDSALDMRQHGWKEKEVEDLPLGFWMPVN